MFNFVTQAEFTEHLKMDAQMIEAMNAYVLASTSAIKILSDRMETLEKQQNAKKRTGSKHPRTRKVPESW